jgi:diacylglycerol O-acyltransferase / wax synthase
VMSWVRVSLGTDTADPVARLRHIRAQTASSATVAQAVGARELTDIGRHAGATTLALTSKMLGRAAAGIGRRAPLANCSIANVPGPSQPLWLCGARMTYFSAIMPIADGMGLVFAVTSYDGRVIISPTSCRELMPDPEHFAQCVRDSFQEYLALAKAKKPARKAAAPKRVAAAKQPLRRSRPAAVPASGATTRRRPAASRASTVLPAAPAGRPRRPARSH